MSGASGDGPAILSAHQELVERVERSARRMKAMAALTIAVSSVLVLSYVSQLLLPLFGTTTITVHLDDPSLVAGQLVVLGLVLAWLYVGAADLAFSFRVGREIREAREREREIEGRISSKVKQGS